MSFNCLCCGYLTLSAKPPGTFEICPVCDWEDDIAQFNHPELKGGANTISLTEARQNFAMYGAITQEACKRVRKPLDEEVP